MKLSIIILSWNTKQLLKQCLKSLISNLKSQISNLEIIVVDNGSSDGSTEMVRKEFRQVCLVENEKNLGFARGNNTGIRMASGDLIMLLNSDTVVSPGAIEQLADFLSDRDGHCQVVSPILLLPNGTLQVDYYMRFPNLWQIFLYHNPILRPFILKISPLRNLICSSPKKRPFEVDQLPGAALMATKKAWDEIGFLDEDFKFLYEDVDWCYRAKRLGFRSMVVPDAKVMHIGGASWKQKLQGNSLVFYRQFFFSMLLFVRKHYGSFRYQIFRLAAVLNFLITLKFRLAITFLFSKGLSGEKLWQ